MMKRSIGGLAALVVLVGVGQSDGVTFFFEPGTPYLSAADIPDGFYLEGSPIALEDFEDGSLDFGIAVSAGMLGSAVGGHNIDSVDADDGVIDGSGLQGESWWHGHVGLYVPITFTFSEPLPTAAALVWTDGGWPQDPGVATLEAFGPGMVSLGSIGPFVVSDDSISGTTAEDRFFGVQDFGGILAIKVTHTYAQTAGGLEVDHIQFGNAVPEPCTLIIWSLLGALGITFGCRRRRCRG